MDNSATKMPKPFDDAHDLDLSSSDNFQLLDDDRLKQEEDYRQELLKVQDEVATLRQVLAAKIKRENELKTLLGIGFVDDLKHDLNETVQDLKSTNAFQRTAETFHAATEKIAPTLQTMNSSLKSRLGLLRNSTYFKTFENTLGSTVSAVKSKVTPSKSVMNFNGNEKDQPRGFLSTSVTHDEHLFYADRKDEKN